MTDSEKLDKILEKLNELTSLVNDMHNESIEQRGRDLAQFIIDDIDSQGLTGLERVEAVHAAYNMLLDVG